MVVVIVGFVGFIGFVGFVGFVLFAEKWRKQGVFIYLWKALTILQSNRETGCVWGADIIKRKIGWKLSEERRRFDAKSFGQRNTHRPVDLMFRVD